MISSAKPRRRRLRTRIARHIAFAVVVSLIAGLTALTVLRHLTLRTTMEEAAATYSALISQPMAEAARLYAETGRRMLRQRVDRLMTLNPDVVKLVVVDVSGSTVLSADSRDVMTFPAPDQAPTIADAGVLDAVRGLETSTSRVLGESGDRVFQVVAPAVEEWGRHRYSLVATFSYRRLNRELTSAIAIVAGFLVVGLVLAERVSVVLSRTITRDVDRLREGVRRIQEGRLEERVEVHSHDEIQELAVAFNVMAEKLSQTIERLQAANRELETLDQAKADLVANVSHELKTPLTALRGYLELLAEGSLGALGEEAGQAVDVCLRNVTRLTVRIEELVQLSRFERSGIHELTMESVHCARILHQVVETLTPRIDEKGVICTLNLASDMPAVWGSPEHLERVFLNLIDNAAKFTSKGGYVRIGAEPFTRDQRPGVLIRVADTGVGIPSSELLRIFDRFYQVDPSARRRYGGMGLGLSLVRSIVDAHHGAVWVESEVGRGSVFFVWLPTRPSEDSSGQHVVVRRSSSGRLTAGHMENRSMDGEG